MVRKRSPQHHGTQAQYRNGRVESRSRFENYRPGDVRHLIEQYPLAWVIGAGGEEASLLPLVGVFDEEDRVTELIGHFALTNPLGDAFAQNPRGTILFKGADAYISPSLADRRDWGPTWNYAQVRIQAAMTVDPDLTASAVALLVEHVERHQPEPWRATELGERYDRLIRQIVGFRARVERLDATFKLGQTETPDTLQAILSNLTDPELVRWMRRFNPARTVGENDV